MASPLRILLLSAASVVSAISFGQGGNAPTVSLKVATASVVANKPVQAVLTVTFPEGLHAYQNPASDPTLIPITVKAGDKVFKVLKVNYPKGTPASVGGESKPVNVYEGTIMIPVTLQAPTKLGKSTINLSLGYQECNAQACFPPGTVSAKVAVTVVKTMVKKQLSSTKGRL
jgi:DsbC/DsbD-like thiol-disulfide interchange protein